MATVTVQCDTCAPDERDATDRVRQALKIKGHQVL